jgi:hypothetical protein
MYPSGAAGIVGAGGNVAQGGTAASAGMAGAPTGTGGTPTGMGGTASVPPGQLMCGGKLCHAGGRCAMDGSCPAFLGACFSTVDQFQSCGAYCSAKGFACAEKSCGGDGSPITGGFSWVSYPASGRAECEKSASPDKNSFDACVTPIWLSASKPPDDVIRCCCKG